MFYGRILLIAVDKNPMVIPSKKIGIIKNFILG